MSSSWCSAAGRCHARMGIRCHYTSLLFYRSGFVTSFAAYCENGIAQAIVVSRQVCLPPPSYVRFFLKCSALVKELHICFFFPRCVFLNKRLHQRRFKACGGGVKGRVHGA